MDRRTFDRAKRILRRRCPLKHPVVVSVVPAARLAADHGGEAVDGDCLRMAGAAGRVTTTTPTAQRASRHYRIRVAGHLGTGAAIDTLLHEWAHARRWGRRPAMDRDKPHDDEWGRAFAEVYRQFVGEVGRE